MTLHQNIKTPGTGEPAVSQIRIVKIPQVDEHRIRHLALNGGATAAREWAATTADRLNSGLRARLELLRSEAQIVADKLSGQIQGYDTQADTRSDVQWRRLSVADALTQMTRMEIVQCVFYILLTLAALSVATYALALMITEKEVVEKLSGSLWNALTYAFPVVLASSGFAAMATLHDDEKVIEARTMRVLKWGAGIFVFWMAMSALVFVGEPGGFNEFDILNDANDPFATAGPLASVSAIDDFYAVLGAVFPTGLTSALLLFVHIVAEVLIAAGLTARVVLMGRKTRQIEAFHCKRSELAREKAKTLDLEKRSQTTLIANYTHQIAEIDAVKAQFIEDVMLLASSEERIAAALRQAAQAKADYDFLHKNEGVA